jgi:hypothetical protein
MRNIILFLMIALIVSCNSGPRQAEELPSEESFLQKMSAYCGKELSGGILADSQQPEFVGQEIRFHFLKCTENEIRILTVLPNEMQKTIILTLVGEEILLKHDVRNPDLSPADYTMYGGFSNKAGDENRQFFPVHNFGQTMWPGFENFSWEIRIQHEGNLEYTERTGNVVMKHYIVPLVSVN